MKLERGSAPPLPEDPLAPHTLATPGHRRVALGLDGLAAQAERWAGAHPETALAAQLRADPKPALDALIQAQTLHALTHLLDRAEGWSRDPAFRALSGWHRIPWLGGPEERHPRAFARAEGRASPAEDLATLADLLLLERPAWASPEEADDAAPCRMPSKAHRLAELAGLEGQEPWSKAGCSPLEAVGLGPDRVDEIDLVYVAPIASAASIAGHMLLALRGPPDADGLRREEALGLVADNSGAKEGSPAYIWKGISGGFPGFIAHEPLQTTLLRYSELEHRDVRLYRMRLSPDQQEQVLRRMDEIRQGWDRPYRFFTGNCVRLPEEMAAVLLGDDYRRIRPLSPDVLMARLARAGLIEELPLDRVEAFSLAGRALSSDRLARALLDELAEGAEPALKAELRRAERALRRKDPARRVAAYRSLAGLVPQLDEAGRAALIRALVLRDPVERLARAEQLEREEGEPGPDLSMEALRAALFAARAGQPPREQDLSDAAVLSSLSPDRSRASMFTPFRPRGVFAIGALEGGEIHFGPGFSTALYDGRAGPGRRFPLSDDPAARLLVEELSLSDEPWTLRSHTILAELLALPERTGWLRAGGRLTLGELDVLRGPKPELEATWLRVDGVLSLRPSARWQRDLRPSLGLALQGLDEGEDAPPRPILALPARVEGVIGSGLQQRSALRAAGELAPSWSPGVGWTLKAEAEADLGLHLGVVAGRDLTLSLGAAARWGEPLGEGRPDGGSVRMGIWAERY